ncbi:MAG: 3-deoxy-7-phosphoheptulonate synthase [Congregibacter sp.]|nr:3-deoxy-7-phosphoheptulonate synthase [Congregibacter sp.]MDP5071660.1 3-deoxy-7-phosphoheptulonate synthase [Congregibacter sp.]
MKQRIYDTRIRQAQPLITPWVLADEQPLSDTQATTVREAREQIENILSGKDKRLLVIVGPCSVHDPVALLEFATALKSHCHSLNDALLPVLRVYFEKPRTVVGWKGLINDPDLDGSFHINKGLRLAREALRDVADLGLAAASEFLDTTFGQYYADLVSFAAIGARTVESQIHRELASGLSMPVGFKNATNGDIDVAIDAIRSANHSHWFPSLTREGTPAILQSTGNPHSYLILRGGKATGPNYNAAAVHLAASAMASAGLEPGVIVDCSHGNSEKDPQRQMHVAADIADQIEQGQTALRGLMLESHLVGGNQSVTAGAALNYGQSITDACLSLEDTLPVLDSLAAAVRRARL